MSRRTCILGQIRGKDVLGEEHARAGLIGLVYGEHT